ncbi:MAG TPA: OsmC family protein [Chitinophagales bacterium]|jgi:putative redox protein|nr:OsmC family protein [Chitinophagales bacterium]
MYTSKIEYLGELRTEATHLQSGNQIITDAPTDNHGKGEAFSPTDLVATALASCMISIMGIKLQGSGKDIKGATSEVTKVMYSEPRRIGEIHVKISVPDNNFSEKEKQILINAAHACPVAKSLHPDIKQVITITFY